MEIKDLKVGDRFISWDGKKCSLLEKSTGRAKIQSDGNSHEVALNTPIEEIINATSDSADIEPIEEKKELPMKKEKDEKKESAKILAFSAKLPATFEKVFKGKTHTVHRTGENKWEVNDKAVGGIREAMNHILVENNGRTADNFFNCALVEKKAKAKPKAKAEKKVKAKAEAKPKKVAAKKAPKKSTGAETHPFSKEKQLGK